MVFFVRVAEVDLHGPTDLADLSEYSAANGLRGAVFVTPLLAIGTSMFADVFWA